VTYITFRCDLPQASAGPGPASTARRSAGILPARGAGGTPA